MRDPDRMEPLLKMLLEYWQKHGNTDQRLGQLMINLMRDAEYPGTNDAGPQLFSLEDEALFDMLDEMLDKEDPDPSRIAASRITTGRLSVPRKPSPRSAHSSGTSVTGWTPVPGTGGSTMHIGPAAAAGPDPSAIMKALGAARSAAFEKKAERDRMRMMRKDGRAK